MRKVLTNDMVKHVWAQQSQPHGRNSSDSISFDGAVLHSYATSIAIHYGDFVLAADPSQFSVTTNRHTPSAYDVSPARCIVIPEFFEWSHRYHSKRDYPKGGEIKKALISQLVNLSAEYGKKRTEHTRGYVANDIERKTDDLRFICERFNLVMPAGYSSLENILQTSAAEAEKMKKAADRKRKKEVAAQKKKQAEDKADFEAWLNGDSNYLPQSYYYAGKRYLTVRDGKVITSGGAECPVEHAKKAFILWRRIVSAGKTWKRNGERCQLGHFQLDRIDASGNAAAGCHLFERAELERFAGKWGF